MNEDQLEHLGSERAGGFHLTSVILFAVSLAASPSCVGCRPCVLLCCLSVSLVTLFSHLKRGVASQSLDIVSASTHKHK